jgi:hypothetical protein
LAALLAVASSWAYSDAATVCGAIGKYGIDNDCELFRVFNDAMFIDANAFLITSKCRRLAIVSFRGTPPTNIIDWLIDASVMSTQFGGSGHVHGGFYNNVTAVWNVVAARLQQIVREWKESEQGAGSRALPAIFLTGHSLGGAMAAIAAAIAFEDEDYRELRDHLCGIYTFGQPMIGNKILADQCEQRFGKMTFRHVYNADIVPQLPPRTTGEFGHFGVTYRSARDGWTLRPRPIKQLASVLLSLPVSGLAWVAKQFPDLGWLEFPWSIADHSPINYLETSLRSGLKTTLSVRSSESEVAAGAPGPVDRPQPAPSAAA